MSDNNKKTTTSENRRTTKDKKSSNKKKFFKALKIFLVLTILVGFIGAGAVAGIVFGIIKDAEPIDPSNIYDLLETSSFILDSNGQVIEKIQSNNVRMIVDYDEIPKHLVDAFVSIEDERFWTHSGVDLKGIIRAFWTNFTTGSRQGASTINQQLAGNIYLSRSDRSYSRKIKDAYYGIQLNRQLTKEQILEAYLNTIPLGGLNYGVQAASQAYFSKDVGELTLAESALIAGITRSPHRYSPLKYLYKDQIQEHHHVIDDSDGTYTIIFNEETLTRQKTVLGVMRRNGVITDAEYDAALEEDIVASLDPNRLAAEDISSYFGDLVKKDVLNALENEGYTREEAQTLLYSGGLKIFSTMDVNMQRIVEEEYANSSNFPSSREDDNGLLQPQSAMVIIDQHTGEIKALVGGRGSSGQQIFNRALNPRPPGSSIKPIAVYTAAIDNGFTTASVIDDVPIYLDRNRPDEPWPKNFGTSGYKGLTAIRQAVQESNNVIPVKIASMLGHDDRSSFKIMFDYMEKMGISTIVTSEDPVVTSRGRSHDETYSTALGGMTKGVTPLDLTTAYATLANSGVRIDPITFTEVYDRYGNLLIDNKPTVTRVLTPQVSFIMTDLLKSAVTSGTGSTASLYGGNSRIPVAGKTGTTTSNEDAWFAGYTPYYTAAVWIGNDMPSNLGQGSRASAQLWNKIMKRIHEDLSPKDFDEPSDIIRVQVCRISGKLPGPYCALDPRGNLIRTELFIKGTEPTTECDLHVMAEIHTPTGKLATDLTPPWEVETRLLVRRPVPYYPEENKGIKPADYNYDLPTEYYDPLTDWIDVNPYPGNNNSDQDDIDVDITDPPTDDNDDDDDDSDNDVRNIIRNIFGGNNNNNNSNDNGN
ncbi:transglycosylase domain-containing protein [Alkaliphilus transvaalensis]|uniref:transglycosylase domain-containing protein n=1 Tax=Alkaliphilus transvaalensis TaxID=114628 RepID=UPI00068598CC|nr:PBP1A family penicillin-binding protein [Alkaliphilus transvaalensis]